MEESFLARYNKTPVSTLIVQSLVARVGGAGVQFLVLSKSYMERTQYIVSYVLTYFRLFHTGNQLLN